MLLLTDLGRGECLEWDRSECDRESSGLGPIPTRLPNLLLGKHVATLSRTKHLNRAWVLGLAGCVSGRPL